jgi:hypothetical protein
MAASASPQTLAQFVTARTLTLKDQVARTVKLHALKTKFPSSNPTVIKISFLNDIDKPPTTAHFKGSEFIGYDFRESGGQPIVSTLDEISLSFKTKAFMADGLLFYSGNFF